MEIELIILIVVYLLLGVMYSYGFSNGEALPFLATWFIWPLVLVFILGYLHAYQFRAILNRDKEIERINEQNKLHSKKRATK